MFEALANASKSEISVVSKAMGTMTFDSKSDTESEAGGVALSSTISEHSSEGGVELFQKQRDIEDLAPPHSHINMDITALKLKYAELIKHMRAKVQEFLGESRSSCHTDSAKLPKIQIIEAFLLFSDPSTILSSDSDMSRISRLLTVFHTFLLKLEDNSAKLAQKGHIGEDYENERTQIEQHIQSINNICKRGMMEHFSCKLWLTISEIAARERRFTRPAYIDIKDGGLREPGQMWKTEGYLRSMTGLLGKTRVTESWADIRKVFIFEQKIWVLRALFAGLLGLFWRRWESWLRASRRSLMVRLVEAARIVGESVVIG
jgi:hypothetical protein